MFVYFLTIKNSSSFFSLKNHSQLDRKFVACIHGENKHIFMNFGLCHTYRRFLERGLGLIVRQKLALHKFEDTIGAAQGSLGGF